MTSTPRDAGIPVLTEIIDLDTPPAGGESEILTDAVAPVASAALYDLMVQPPAEDPSPSPPLSPPADILARRLKPLFPTRASQIPPAVRLPTLQTAEEAEAEAVATWTPEQWNRMELALRERILGQILLHVDSVLDAKVRDALADVLQASVTRLADDLRASLRMSLADTIERAVQQEISRLQTSK
jgi:hypothetical protein